MVITEFGIMVFLQPDINSFFSVSIMALQLSLESYTVLPSSTIIEVKPLQPEKAPTPILVTELGIVIEVKPLQPEKALPPILVTELGIVIEIKLLHSEKVPRSMLVTELGIITEVKPLQPMKA